MELIQKIDQLSLAEGYARLWHRGQTYGDLDYVDGHVLRVVSTLISYGAGDDHEMQIAGMLHDGPEDSGDAMILYGRVKLIKYEFGDRPHRLVWAVTGRGANRKQRVADWMQKIRDYREAAFLKAADRLENARSSRITKPDLHKMYRKEYPDFRALVQDAIPAEMLAALDEAHELPR